MKGNIFNSYYSQLENQLTEAFIKLLKHSTPEITNRFINYIGLHGHYSSFIYDFQFNNDVQMDINRAVLVGIAETQEIVVTNALIVDSEDELEEQEGIPDAYIYSIQGSLALLFEMKRGLGRLHRNQLNAHKQRFSEVEISKVEEVIITWRQIFDFFINQKSGYNHEHRNYLLIENFIEFCEYHFVGELISTVSYERILKRYDSNGFLKEINDYIIKLSNKDPKIKNDSLDYSIGEKTFFTIWFTRGLLVLKPKKMIGLYLDLLVAKAFGRNCITSYDNKTQETFIHIDWINKPEHLESVKEMIQLAYDNKIRNFSFDTKHFVINHQIGLIDFQRSRMGRKNLSYFGKKLSKVEILSHEVFKLLND